MVLSALRDIYDYSRIKKRQPAIFLVTATTDNLASRLFLREVNDILSVALENRDSSLRFNESGNIDTCNIFGITVKFLGLNKKDSYQRIKGETVFGWLGTEITTYNPHDFRQCIDRVSAWKKNIYLDANPQDTSHWVYINHVAPNLNNPLGTEMKICLVHFNYLDSLTLFEGAKDYWAIQESMVYGMKDVTLSKDEYSKLYKILLTRTHISPDDKQALNIIDKLQIPNSEIVDKLGFWMGSQLQPLRNLLYSRQSLYINLIRDAYSVAFLDLANTANDNSCFTALAIVWKISSPLKDTYYFTGRLYKQPYYNTLDDIEKALCYYNVDQFFYDLHGAGVGMKDLPQFERFSATGLLQTRNKLSRIADLSLLIDEGILLAHPDCCDHFFQQVRDFRFTQTVENKEIPIKKIKGYCDAPDALESALRVFENGVELFNKDDHTFRNIVLKHRYMK
jgi:hypothetical protein